MGDFADLGLSAQTLRALAEMEFEEATPIQEHAIPVLLAGRDLVAQALTGTGKTAAFGVPIVERVDPARRAPQAVVLTPTRELAVQVTDQIGKMGRLRGVTAVPIYGGQPIGRQLHTLARGVHVIVATPGRLLDHMRRGTADLSGVGMIVLDEADQMLDMGFIEDIELILQALKEDRVTALFSATMPDPIVKLAQKHMRDAESIRLSKPQGMTVPEIDQVYYVVPYPRKLDALCRVLDARQPVRTMVFCATKRMVDEVVEGLQARGYLADGLHGDHTQATREKVLRTFRSGRIEVLVATDVAARGLDVPEVSHVVNFDIPPDPEYYVHRIGRTGRLGRSGEAITFVNPRQMRELKVIERVTGAHIRREEVPTVAEVEEREFQALEERLQASLASGTWGRYRSMIEELADEHDPIDLAAAALAMAVDRAAAADRRPAPRPHDDAFDPSAERAPRPDRGNRPAPRQDRERSESRPSFNRQADRGERPPFQGNRPPLAERPRWQDNRPEREERPRWQADRAEHGERGDQPDRAPRGDRPFPRRDAPNDGPRRERADGPKRGGTPGGSKFGDASDGPKFGGKPGAKRRPPTGGGTRKPHRKGPPSSGRRKKQGER